MSKIIVNNPETIEGYKVVNDGKEILKCLQNGETIMHYEFGNSLFPILKSGEYCKITPIGEIVDKGFFVGKPVFCHFVYPLKEGGYGDFYMVHRCTEVYERDGEVYFRIDSTDGNCFGWTKDVYGIAESTGYFQDESVLWNL